MRRRLIVGHPPARRNSFLLLLPLVLLLAVEAAITPLGAPPSQIFAELGRCVLREHDGVVGAGAMGYESQCTKNKYFSISTCHTTAPRVGLAGDKCSLLDLTDPALYAKKRSIVFWGDSLTVQMYDALICLLQEAWDSSKPLHTSSGAVSSRRLMSDDYRGGDSLLPAHHPRNYRKTVRVRVVGYNQKIATGCKAEPQDECHRFGGLRVCYLRLIDHYEDMARGRTGCLGRLGAGPDSLHIFNFGLWYPSNRPSKKGKPPPTYPQALKLFRRFVTDALASLPPGPRPHLLWRETTPQFFDTPGGNYDRMLYSKESLSECKSTVDAADMASHEWRNSAASVALAGVPGMEVFHVWELLRPWGPRLTVRTPLATEKGKTADCTHWCPGPLKAIGHLLLTDVFNRYWGNRTTV